ncbi:aspartate/glutamate racemase family protein [Falsihalocynthiibacter sp. S25ZX9]|uniref:aspartate/glutamate racemase family protein n=1 Tax=Falsihalocynthiibacter sp. S25ZX9 TaxID=3240870 RepID=UPI00350F2B6D
MIVIINPNSTETMTDAMVDIARSATLDVAIEGWTSHDGPPAIQGPRDGEASIPPLLKLVRLAVAKGAQAIIIGCFDDTGLSQARKIAACPVIGIGQAAYHLAALAGERFSVVTTLDVSVPVLESNIQSYGLTGHLAKVRASGVPVLDLETDPETANPKVIAEINRAVSEDRVQSVVLGCAGMVGIPAIFGEDSPVRLVDGVVAATKIARILI